MCHSRPRPFVGKDAHPRLNRPKSAAGLSCEKRLWSESEEANTSNWTYGQTILGYIACPEAVHQPSLRFFPVPFRLWLLPRRSLCWLAPALGSVSASGLAVRPWMVSAAPGLLPGPACVRLATLAVAAVRRSKAAGALSRRSQTGRGRWQVALLEERGVGRQRRPSALPPSIARGSRYQKRRQAELVGVVVLGLVVGTRIGLRYRKGGQPRVDIHLLTARWRTVQPVRWTNEQAWARCSPTRRARWRLSLAGSTAHGGLS